jgi:beta-lactamase regulating signal transducer with metallopeptidase domain
MGHGVLLAFPLQSVALRLAVALALALLLLRVLSGRRLRSPRARVLLAISPFVVAGAVIVLSARDLALPALLRPTTIDAGSIALPVADRYLDFAPTAPILLGVWATATLLLTAGRILRSTRFRRDVLRRAVPAPPLVAVNVVRLAREFGVTPPRALLIEGRIAGAAVIGVRDPVLLLDAASLAILDGAELEGVIAHELAHVARRDNLVAWLVAAVRDVVCFVPGAGSALEALHREREAAADQDAVAVTKRPGALASGLLAVVGLGAQRPLPQGCAALAPSSGVVDRVRFLLDENRPTAARHRLEVLLAAMVSLAAVLMSLLVPNLLSGADGQRDALGVLVAPAPDRAAVLSPTAGASEGRVFDVYRRLGDARTASSPVASAASPVEVFGPEDRPGVARLCTSDVAACPTKPARVGLGLRPTQIVLLEDRVMARWQATPVLDGPTGDRLAVYWLSRLDGLAATPR